VRFWTRESGSGDLEEVEILEDIFADFGVDLAEEGVLVLSIGVKAGVKTVCVDILSGVEFVDEVLKEDGNMVLGAIFANISGEVSRFEGSNPVWWVGGSRGGGYVELTAGQDIKKSSAP